MDAILPVASRVSVVYSESMTPEEMADRIRKEIREGVLGPGQPLVQDELAERFGVSRIPLREALRVVAGEGLVVMHRSRGAVVAHLSADEAAELYDLRLHVEPPLAGHIVACCSDRALERLAASVEAMERIGRTDAVEWSGVNYEFHRSMYELVERPHTLRVVTQLLNLVERYSRMYVHHLDALGRVHREHAEMIEALRRHDAGRLAGAITQHLGGARERLLEEMGRPLAGRRRTGAFAYD
jgi:DNA-binding GntR family transcriptional regulator